MKYFLFVLGLILQTNLYSQSDTTDCSPYIKTERDPVSNHLMRESKIPAEAVSGKARLAIYMIYVRENSVSLSIYARGGEMCVNKGEEIALIFGKVKTKVATLQANNCQGQINFEIDGMDDPILFKNIKNNLLTEISVKFASSHRIRYSLSQENSLILKNQFDCLLNQ